MKSFVAVVLACFLFSSVFAEKDGDKTESVVKETETVYFAGIVKDKATGEYLVGVEVEIEGTNLKTYSDFDGNFTFENIAPGTYSISANYISYEKEELENMEINSRTNLLELELRSL